MWDSVENAVHMFFRSRGFLHVRTPLLVRTPGMEPNLDPIEVAVTAPAPSLKRRGSAALITSPEYSMKKLLGAGLEKIYTITPVFRNNEGGSHNTPEFTMLEWYAPGSYEDLMAETEDLLKHVLEDDSAWQRLTYEEAQVDEYGDPHVQEKRFFVTKYPVEQAALARIVTTPGPSLKRRGVAEQYAERFEAFGDGMELCNGFAELTDPVEQRKRFEKEQEERRALGKTVFPIDEELLDALGRIKMPVYGNALGIDRLVMLKYGVSDIRDIQMFPGISD